MFCKILFFIGIFVTLYDVWVVFSLKGKSPNTLHFLAVVFFIAAATAKYLGL